MRTKKGTVSVEALRDAALEGLGDESVEAEGDEVEERARKPRPVDPSVVALFPSGVVVLHEMIAAASKAWRDATEREAPSIEKLSMAGAVERVDVDALSGYVAVVTPEETWRAFVPREQVAIVVALIVRQPIEEVARVMAKGPAAFAPVG